MNDNSPALKARPIAILLGGLLVGVMDATAASTHAWLRGVPPSRVWQYVASGAIGPDSYNRGMSTVFLGLGFHFIVAFGAATVFYLLSRSFPVLLQKAVIVGICYGVIVYFFMGRVVAPLSYARRLPFSFQQMLIGLAIHIVCVGLPIALVARKCAKR
jgi:uncharacterized membrane protein YagU involved in acid resistance